MEGETPENKNDMSGMSDPGSNVRLPFFKESGFWTRLYYRCRRKAQYEFHHRVVKPKRMMYPPVPTDNHIKNTKYNLITFLPGFFYNQFKYFFNFYYLCLCLSQFVEELKIGFLFTYIGPLAFVLFLSLFNEVVDEVTKYLRDFEANNEKYEIVEDGLLVTCRSGDLQVGDIIVLEEGRRVPADVIILGLK